LGHRQAFTWIDEWYNMTIEDVREYENQMHKKTNEKVRPTGETNGDTEPTAGDEDAQYEKIQEISSLSID
jgi:hypothetical protein